MEEIVDEARAVRMEVAKGAFRTMCPACADNYSQALLLVVVGLLPKRDFYLLVTKVMETPTLTPKCVTALEVLVNQLLEGDYGEGMRMKGAKEGEAS